MRRLILSIVIILAMLYPALSQNVSHGVFVMVDLSMNISGESRPITPQMREDALDFTRSIITANFKLGQFPNWKKTGVSVDPQIENILQGKGKPLVHTDDFLMIMPFGEIKTCQNFKINEIRSYPSDFNAYYKFPFAYDDKDTWGDYAEAKVCNIAYNNKIPQYYIIRIQGRPDDPNSQLLSTQDQDMIDEYVTGSVGEVMARFKHTGASSFSVTIKKVDITKIPGMKNYPVVTIKPTNTDRISLRIVSPKGESNNPYSTESNKIRVSWICTGCDSTATYTLTVNNLSTKKTRSYKSKVNSKSMELERGAYKLSVSTSGVRSKPQYLEIEKEGGNFWILIILILLAVGGYFGYKYFKRIPPTSPGKEEDTGNGYVEDPRPNTTPGDDDWS